MSQSIDGFSRFPAAFASAATTAAGEAIAAPACTARASRVAFMAAADCAAATRGAASAAAPADRASIAGPDAVNTSPIKILVVCGNRLPVGSTFGQNHNDAGTKARINAPLTHWKWSGLRV